MKINKSLSFTLTTVSFLFIGICITLTGRQNNSGVDKFEDDIKISQSQSTKFSNDEISNAIDCVIAKFNSDFNGCKLTDIWYEENISDVEIISYLNNGPDSANGVDAKNAIVLLSNFDVDVSGGDGSFLPNSTYTDWKWTLIRNSMSDNWKVDEWGY